jgi:catechol-2,3-dioxygenase
VPAPQKLAHVVLFSAQKDALRDWYLKVLSARVQLDSELVAFLAYDDEHHRIAIAQIDDAKAPTPPATGLAHIAFTFTKLDDLLQTFDDLRNDGIEPVWTVNHGLTTSIYYADPDGNNIELQVDNFATSEEGNAYLRSDRFAANPIGVSFDPQTYLTRLRNGEPSDWLIEELARADGERIGLTSAG